MRSRFAVLAGAMALVFAACGGGAASQAPSAAAPSAAPVESAAASVAAPASQPAQAVTIKVWGHQGQDNEVAVTKKAVADFNALGNGITVEMTFIPEGDYGKTLGATKPEDLPDVVEVPGENVASLVYAGKLGVIDGVVAQDALDNQITSTVAEGTVGGKRYAVAQFDSGLALYGNKAMLDAAGVTYPTTWDKAWTAAEFGDALAKLAAKDSDGKVIDIKENYAGTWPGYAFLPIVNSAGYLAVKGGAATGNLNAAPVVEAFKTFASWKKYVDPSADDKAFSDKRAGLAWVGHWQYTVFKDAIGADLVVIPLPDFGAGTKSGQGSYAWAMSSKTANAAAAAKFIEFLMTDEQVAAMTDVNGAAPGTKTATAKSKLYAPGGPLELYSAQLAASCGGGDVEMTKSCVDVPRTISPAWPVINDAFSKAFWNIYNGGDAQAELDAAAKTIDQDYADNGGYQQ
jgi:multiple sugar transport system substrate-binding protein